MSDFNNASIRLKTARLAAGFKSARDFCNQNNIPSSTYSLHETGGRNIKPQIAKKYAELLGINVSWLLTGIGSPYNNSEVDDESISANKFMDLIQYQGNSQLNNLVKYQFEPLNNVDPLVFCIIVKKIYATISHLEFSLSDKQIADKSVEIYNDIVSSSKERETQIAMIDLSVTTFKRQVLELINKPKSARA